MHHPVRMRNGSCGGRAQIGEGVVGSAHTQQEIAALPMGVCVVRRPANGLVQCSESTHCIAEFFAGVAEIDPEIVVTVAE